MYKYFPHGSHDSLDKDVLVLIPEVLPRPQAKGLCDSFKEFNANLITVKDGVVGWCYKGPIDEVNNGLLVTYNLHHQEHPCPVTRKVDRNKAVKAVRVVRGVLGQFTRTPFRDEVKAVLRDGSWKRKLLMIHKLKEDNALQYIDQSLILERRKFLAFQLGQLVALLDGEEVYTKSGVVSHLPSLEPCLYREPIANTELNQFIGWMCYRLDVSFHQIKDTSIIQCDDGSCADIKTEEPV